MLHLTLLTLLVLLTLLLAFSAGEEGRNAFSAPPLHVQSFRLGDLLDGSQDDDFSEALQTTGLIAIQPENYNDSLFQHVREEALKSMCDCWSVEDDESSGTAATLFRAVEGSDSKLLKDGATTRSTLATATIGRTPLSLPSTLEQACGSKHVVKQLDSLRDHVAKATEAFVTAFDRLLLQASDASSANMPPVLLQDSHGGMYMTVDSIVQASTNLEHFHLYSKKNSKKEPDETAEEEETLRLHTDAGIFLSFVPAFTCHSINDNDKVADDKSFYVQDEKGVHRRVVFPTGTVVVMLGAGAEHWLKTSHQLSLKATHHAVHLQPGQSRAWYGMMSLVPQSAIVQEYPQRTFADMQKAMVLTRQRRSRRFMSDDDEEEFPTVGCGNAAPQEQGHDGTSPRPRTSISRRRRLEMVDDASYCNNSTNFYCWMSCLDIPAADQAQGYINEGYSLYCADPSVLASSGNRVSSAVEPCNQDGVTGAAMNTNCLGTWQPTAPGVPAQEVIVEGLYTSNESEEPFCWGGTSMYMDGFNWIGTTCAVYLFPNWILDTAGKLAGACIGSVAFGVSMEFVIQRRRAVMRDMGPGWKRLVASAFFYGAQLTMGYSLMLVIMIYSAPLFIAVIVGLVVGHILFNAKDALLPSQQQYKATPNKGGGEEEECNPNTEITTGGCCSGGNKKETEDKNEGVPEGSTPCCQNIL